MFDRIKVNIYGESHAEAVGVILSGIPEGKKIDLGNLQAFTDRRKSGGKFTTPRKEEDKLEILSGIENGITTGEDIKIEIKNRDIRPSDYEITKPRPSHADYAGYVKDGKISTGGGRFSGRLTAPLTAAGGIAVQLLNEKGINFHTYLSELNEIKIQGYDTFSPEKAAVIDENALKIAEERLSEIKADLDSAGGVVECVIRGVPAGVGETLFNGLESRISYSVFAVPAVKAVEFGLGKEISALKGSEANDEFYYDGERVKTRTNHNGGINGGISNGMPIVFRAAIKPTPSIGKEQNTIDLNRKGNCKLTIQGRHDCCIALRAAVCIEAAAALALLDAYIQENII